MKKLKVLLITDEVWNDEIHGNNILTNWFEGFDAEFANIYCSPGKPLNNCCKKYFQVTDTMMMKSILKQEKAGRSLYFNELPNKLEQGTFEYEKENQKLYKFLKSITGEMLRLIREGIWCIGSYNINELENFINEFNPDIIFSPRYATLKIMRLEKIVYDLTDIPLVAFTGDDEYSLMQVNFSPFYWIRKIITRKQIKKMMKIYSYYYTLSSEQKLDYQEKFNIEIDVLRKCCDMNLKSQEYPVNKTLKIVYAGKLYCNRWKTLVYVAEAVKRINSKEVKVQFDIYSQDKLTSKQNQLLNDRKNVFFHGKVNPNKVKEIYEKSDIVLHVESFDLRNRLLTKYSFSTKIIDCLSSGSAVMAICWEKHSGYTYLKKEDAAFCINKNENIYNKLLEICENKELVEIYSKKALNCAKKNHQKSIVQKQLYNNFRKLIEKSKEYN